MNGTDLVLQWIPSHCGIVGNDVVDLAAKNACSYNEITILPLMFRDSMNLFNKKISNKKIERWQTIKDTLKFSKSVPDINSWEWLSLNKRSYDVLLARLRSGSTDLNDHLYKIKLETSPFWKFCTNKNETVEHYVFDCTKYKDYRKLLFDELNKLKISQNRINLHLLLTGGEGKSKDKLKILRLFINYVKSTERFNI